MRKILRQRTAEEREILRKMAEHRDWEFVAENVELILTQARLVGELSYQDENSDTEQEH